VSQANSGNIDSARLNSPAMDFARKWSEAFTRGYYTLWVNVTTPGMFPGSNILLSVLVDDMAKKAELKSEAELKTELTSVLRRMYGAGVPEPEAVFCTKWFTDPLALGSFHSIRAGVTREDLTNLKRGIRNLHFAGDGSDVAFIGLLQNAYLTGVEKAQLGLKELQWKSASSLSTYTLTLTNCILQFLMITKCLCFLYYFLF
jgi:monoamine oxidase